MIIRHDLPDADSLVDERDWPGVITFFDGDGAGSLVAPTWILTAAHTARNIPSAHEVVIAGERYQVARVVLHPESRDGEAFFTSVDLTLVELARPVHGVTPFGLYTDQDEVGQEVLLLGRGDYGNGLVGVQGVDHRLRRVTNRIDTVDECWLAFRFDAPPDGTQFEGVGGEGDSGGPALIEREGRWLIAGVSSWQRHTPQPMSTYGCVEHYVRRRVPPDWIARLYPRPERAPLSQPVANFARLLALFERVDYPAERVVPALDGVTVTRAGAYDLVMTTALGVSLQVWQPEHTRQPSAERFRADTLSPTLLTEIGSLLGRLHALAHDTWTMEIDTVGLNPAGEVAYGLHCLAQLEGRVPPYRSVEYRRLVAQLEQIPNFSACPQTLIHGDCHLGNIVVTADGAPVLIDWEAAGRGAAIIDLAQTLSSLAEPDDAEPHVDAVRALMEGYTRHRTLSTLEQRLLPDAIRFRVLVTLAGAFERRCAPDYDPSERFWGATYDDWARHADRAELLAALALAPIT
jgi:Ser/Thr protein kinase RdoA (MazF antagonist)